jgi:Glycosyl hydrolase family 71
MASPPVSDLRSAAPEVMSARRRLAGPRLHLVLMVLATFGASLLITVLLLAAVAARPAVPTAQDAPVLAYYYIWFDRGSWDRAKTDMPILGAYSSSSRQVMREHIEWAKSAGIDGFIVSWKSTEKLDARLRQLVEVARDADFKLAIIYQGLDFDRNPVPVAQVGRDLASFAAEFASDPVFQIRDRPLVVWSGTWEFSRSEIESVTSELRPTLRVLASEKDVDGINRLAGVVDGDAYYWSSVDPETFPNYVDKLTAMSAVVHSQGGLWIVPVATGFDARLIGGTRVITRDDGEHLRRQMELVAQTRPDAIGLISWNEFSENSHIEPSVGHGYRYLDVVREARPLAGLAPMDEDSSDDPASDDPALAQRLLAVSLLGIVTLLGVVMTVRRERRAR